MVRLKSTPVKSQSSFISFQFQMVRLKYLYLNPCDVLSLFQFQMVRLKYSRQCYNTIDNMFQFQMVRLKSWLQQASQPIEITTKVQKILEKLSMYKTEKSIGLRQLTANQFIKPKKLTKTLQIRCARNAENGTSTTANLRENCRWCCVQRR